jgi:hypothetical protein
VGRRTEPESRSGYSLFLSYAAEDSDLVKSISAALPAEGLRGFVATYHISPSREWLPELENELRRCDALVAILGPTFRSSPWTDQEIGFALACGRKVIPLQTSGDRLPHGFLQRYQGLYINGMTPRRIATQLFDLLFAHPDEQRRMVDIVLSRLNAERNQARIADWVRRLELLTSLDDAQLELAQHALASNSVIRNNARTADQMRAVVARCGRSKGSNPT